jgi:hypothetical protein
VFVFSIYYIMLVQNEYRYCVGETAVIIPVYIITLLGHPSSLQYINIVIYYIIHMHGNSLNASEISKYEELFK